MRLVHGVSELQALIDREAIHLSIPDNVRNYIATHLENEFELTDAYFYLAPSAITGVLSAVRNRIVEYTLSIEAEYPNIDAVPVGSSPISTQKLNTLYQVIIMGQGHAINLGGGSGSVHNIEQQIVTGDLESLVSYLQQQDVDPSDLDELKAVIDESTITDLDDESSRIRKWIDKVADAATAGSKDIAKTATREAILLSIRYYFGQAIG